MAVELLPENLRFHRFIHATLEKTSSEEDPGFCHKLNGYPASTIN